MRSKRLFMAIGLLLIVVLHVAVVSLVYACSGGSEYSLEELFTLPQEEIGVEIAIQARVVQTDYFHQNAIVQVQNYFKGGVGPEYLLIQQTDPVDFAGLRAGNRGQGDCARYGQDLYVGDTIIAFLLRTQDGSYSSPFMTSVSLFGSSQALLQVYNPRDPEEAAALSTLIDELEKHAEATPVPPSTTDNQYPLISPLLITTTNGTQYLFPVDRKKLAKQTEALKPEDLGPSYVFLDHSHYKLQPPDKKGCFTNKCLVFSPTGLDAAVVLDGKIFDVVHDTIPGEAILYSVTGELAAIWNEDTLEIHLQSYPRYNTYSSDASQDKPHLNSVKLNKSTSVSPLDNAPYAVWSKDGRFLAYSDAKGLWLWEVYSTQMQPQLVIAAQANTPVPNARYFSEHGRFLAVTEGNERYIIDLLSNEHLPDGLISPDERILLSFDTNAKHFGLEVCHLTLFACYEGGENRYAENIYSDNIHQIAWKTDTRYLLAGCDTIRSSKCTVWEASVNSSEYFSTRLPNTFEGYTFDYDPVSDGLVVLKNASTITINGEDHNIRANLDGDIATVRWLQSLFIAPNYILGKN